MKRSLFVATFILFSGVLSQAWAFAPPAIDSNNEGVKQYQKEDYQGAFHHFAGALAHDPYNPSYHFNLGDAFYRNGEFPKAMAEYEAVEQSPKAANDLKFKAMFNAGNAAIDAKDVPKALQYYQKALDYNPESVETKTNIELALKEQQKQGGGGQQDQKDKNDQKDQNKDKNDKQQQGGQDQKDQKQNQSQNQQQQQNSTPQPTPRPAPRPFKSQALNEGDVRRILEELKRQEEEIRARQYQEHKNPDREIEKDW